MWGTPDSVARRIFSEVAAPAQGRSPPQPVFILLPVGVSDQLALFLRYSLRQIVKARSHLPTSGVLGCDEDIPIVLIGRRDLLFQCFQAPICQLKCRKPYSNPNRLSNSPNAAMISENCSTGKSRRTILSKSLWVASGSGRLGHRSRTLRVVKRRFRADQAPIANKASTPSMAISVSALMKRPHDTKTPMRTKTPSSLTP